MSVMVQDSVISVVVTVRDQAPGIEDYVSAVLAVLEMSFRNFEILIVDDGSTDDSVECIKRCMAASEHIRLISLSRRHGEHVAFAAGLEHAIGDYVIRSSFDDSPELIPSLVAKAEEGADIVYVRIERRDGGVLGRLPRAVTAALFGVAKRWTGLALDPYATTFQLFSRRAVNAATKLKEHSSYVPVLYAFLGYSVATIDAAPGTTKNAAERLSWPKLRQAVDTIVSFSHRPLRYAALLALMISSSAFVGSLYVLIAKITSNRIVEGWASIMVVTLLMFSILFFLLAIVSEYVFRILRESQRRPLYYIREELGGGGIVIDDILEADIPWKQGGERA